MQYEQRVHDLRAESSDLNDLCDKREKDISKKRCEGYHLRFPVYFSTEYCFLTFKPIRSITPLLEIIPINVISVTIAASNIAFTHHI
jgi:hypothetical protein